MIWITSFPIDIILGPNAWTIYPIGSILMKDKTIDTVYIILAT